MSSLPRKKFAAKAISCEHARSTHQSSFSKLHLKKGAVNQIQNFNDLREKGQRKKAMEVVQKAVNEAMHAVRNSPLLRRRFGDREDPSDEENEEFSPEKDRTPFVQGFTYRLEYLGKSTVEAGQEQDHGCCDRTVDLMWDQSKNRPLAFHAATPKTLSIHSFSSCRGSILSLHY